MHLPERISNHIESESSVETHTCERHGKYAGSALVIKGGARIPPLCPKCAAEQAESERDSEQAQRSKDEIESLLRRANIPETFYASTMSNYIPQTDDAQVALSEIQKYVDQWHELSAAGRGLILDGTIGSGKTHLACSALKAIISRHRLSDARYMTASDISRRIRSTYGQNAAETEIQVFNALATASLLVIDEVGGFQAGTAHDRNTLAEVLASRYANKKPVILISNLNTNELQAYLGEQVSSRLRERYRLILFRWGSYRERVGK